MSKGCHFGGVGHFAVVNDSRFRVLPSLNRLSRPLTASRQPHDGNAAYGICFALWSQSQCNPSRHNKIGVDPACGIGC